MFVMLFLDRSVGDSDDFIVVVVSILMTFRQRWKKQENGATVYCEKTKLENGKYATIMEYITCRHLVA